MLSDKCQNTTRDIRLDDKRYNQNLLHSAISREQWLFGRVTEKICIKLEVSLLVFAVSHVWIFCYTVYQNS